MQHLSLRQSSGWQLFPCLRLLALCWMMTPAASSALDLGKPDLPAPPRAVIGQVSNGLVINGIKMNMRQFKTSLSVDQVLGYYRALWPAQDGPGPGYTITDALRPWQIMTRVDNGYLMTVQVASSGSGSAGYLAISKLPGPHEELPEPGSGFPMIRGSHVFNDIQADDPGQTGRTVSLVNDFSVATNADYYRQYYGDRGWLIDLDRGDGMQTCALIFRSNNQTVTITINKAEGRTVVVAQNVKRDLF